ncbi:hypothetical protein BH24ACI3_BH24ACI3_03100 [soil metagenome]
MPQRPPFLLIIFVLSLVFSAGCERFRQRIERTPSPVSTPAIPDNLTVEMPASVHLAFGNPSKATIDPANRNNFLIVGEGSAIAYNDSRGSANWVSWRTTREDLGASIPRPDFQPDPRLPDGFRRIGYYDYSGSGFERGHLVPSADRFANARLNEETFLMTNMVPQKGALNQYPWQKLESYARGQARRVGDVYQIAGCYGEQERLKDKVAAPTNCWKVIAVVPRGKLVSDLDRRMRIIAVDMPNSNGIENERWERYKTTIREIERRTGLDLLNNLPQDAQDRLETRMEIQNK